MSKVIIQTFADMLDAGHESIQHIPLTNATLVTDDSLPYAEVTFRVGKELWESINDGRYIGGLLLCDEEAAQDFLDSE